MIDFSATRVHLDRHQGVQKVIGHARPDLDVASPGHFGYISTILPLPDHHVADLLPLPLLFTSHAQRSGISSILACGRIVEM